MNEPVIRTEKLTRTYSMGASCHYCFEEAELSVKAGEFIALDGRIGERQVHSVEFAWLAGPADIR